MIKLTERQEEIAKLAARGLSSKLIARQLGLTEGTVKIHMHYILARLGIRFRVVLAAQWKAETPLADDIPAGNAAV